MFNKVVGQTYAIQQFSSKFMLLDHCNLPSNQIFIAFLEPMQVIFPTYFSILRLLRIETKAKSLKNLCKMHFRFRANDALQYQQLLHRNLVYLASLADANIQQELAHQVSSFPSCFLDFSCKILLYLKFCIRQPSSFRLFFFFLLYRT